MRNALFLLAFAGSTQVVLATGPNQGPVVRAVLFFSPTCPHCHQVIQQDLPRILERFGGEARVWYDRSQAPDNLAYYVISNGRVEILLVDASTAAGNAMYRESTERLGLPQRRQGVPRLVVADSVMVGSAEIPEHFPRLIEEGLAAAGVDWPDLAGLDEALAAVPGWEGGRERLAGAEEGAEAATTAQPDAAVDSSIRPEPAARRGEPAEPDAELEEAAPETEDAGTQPPVSAADATAPETPGVEASRPARDSTVASAPGSPAPADSSPESSGAHAEASDRSAGLPSADKPAVESGSRLADIAGGRATVGSRLRRDPLGNGLALLTLAAMIGSVLAVAWLFLRGPVRARPLGLSIPALALLGLVVAAYLSYVETSGATAVCGPVGDCNAVQQSEYADLFGVPVGLLGFVGYVAILGAWLLGRAAGERSAATARLALLLLAFVGTAFSIYLTFLEPFVIGATCVWCLMSAVILTVLMWLSLGPARESWLRLREASS